MRRWHSSGSEDMMGEMGDHPRLEKLIADGYCQYRGATEKMPHRKSKGQGKSNNENVGDPKKSEYELLRDANVALLKQQMMPVVAAAEALAKSCHKTRRSNQKVSNGDKNEETQPLRRSKRVEEDIHKGNNREDNVKNTIDSDNDSEDARTSDDSFFESRDEVVVEDSEDDLLQAPENILCAPIAKEKGKGKTISFVDNSGGRGGENKEKAVNGGTKNVPSYNPWQIPRFPASWMSQGYGPWMQTQGRCSPLQGVIPWMNLGGDWFKQGGPSTSSMPIDVDPKICTEPPHQEIQPPHHETEPPNQETQPPQETLGRKLESEHRSLNRIKRKEVHIVGERRRAQGLKPFKVKVQRGGVIDAGCEGKNQWDDMVRTITPRILDLSKLSWNDQKDCNILKLRVALDNEFEDLDNEPSYDFFRRYISGWLNSERSRLKARFLQGNWECPLHVQPEQWEDLKKYWVTPEASRKAAKMRHSRSCVVNVSKLGRSGFAGKEAVARRKRNRSPGLTEIADDIRDQEQVSTTSVGSGRLQSRVTSLEKRFVEMDEKLSTVLERSTLVLSMLEKVVGPMENSIKSNVMDKSDKSDTSNFQANNDFEEKYDGKEDDGIDKSVSPREITSDKNIEAYTRSDKMMESGRGSRGSSGKHHANSKNVQGGAEEKGGGIAEKRLRAKNITTMFEVEDEVWLLNPSATDMRVAVGTVISCSSAGKIHGESIPDAYVKVCVTKAICPDAELMKQNPNGDQFKIIDVVGSFTIWKKQYLMKL